MGLATVDNILDTGILPQNHALNIESLLAQAESRIIRLLAQTWWRTYLRDNRTQNPKLNPQLLNPEQWQACVVAYALAFVILPKLSQLSRRDFSQAISHYYQEFENQWRTLLEFGFDYDVEGVERGVEVTPEPVDYLRMR